MNCGGWEANKHSCRPAAPEHADVPARRRRRADHGHGRVPHVQEAEEQRAEEVPLSVSPFPSVNHSPCCGGISGVHGALVFSTDSTHVNKGLAHVF